MAFQGARPTLGDAAALGFISSLGPFAVNAYIPGFHAMAADFGADFVAVEQTMTIYLVTYAVSCLFAGTISDAVGRKPAMAGGMLIFAAASIGALLSTSLLALYFWRFVQGIGASVGQVVSQAMVRDCWSGLNAAGMNGMIAVFFALAPAFAPVIGGWIVVHAGWHGVFALLALYSCLIALYTLFGLPETLPRERRTPFAPMAVLGGYRRCFGNAAFMAGAVSHGLCFMGGSRRLRAQHHGIRRGRLCRARLPAGRNKPHRRHVLSRSGRPARAPGGAGAVLRPDDRAPGSNDAR